MTPDAAAARLNHSDIMLYKATISSTPLRVRESRAVARLLLEGVNETEWRQAVEEDNALGIDSVVGVIRSARILRKRLQPLGEAAWLMVRDGDLELATQTALAGTVRDSRLLGDFMDLTLREQRAAFATQLERRHWAEFIEACRGRDPEMPHWSDTTLAKLRSIVFSILAEAKYLKDTRSLQVQTVFVREELKRLLEERGERYVLRCLEVCE